MFSLIEERQGPPGKSKNKAKGKSRPLEHFMDNASLLGFRIAEGSGGQALAGSLRVAKGLTKFSVQTAPAMVIAAAVVAYLGGNISEETVKTLGEHCTDKTLSICDEAHLFERLSDKDKLLLSALLDTSADPNEKRAISAIGVAAAKSGVDLLFMMGFAQLESSLGKLQNAETSSAQGIFQYIEETWLTSFKRWAPQYSEEYARLADKITITGGKPKVTGEGIRHKILSLRKDDPDFHSYVTAHDMARSDDMVLARHWADAPSKSAGELLDFAQRLNMGRTAQAAAKIWQDVQDLFSRPLEQAQRDLLIERKQALLIDTITDAYFEHFLGKTGKERFMALYDNKNARERYRPVSTLIGHAKQPVSAKAIAANGNIFMGGEASVVDTYEIVRARVERAFDGFDRRVEIYLQRQLQEIEIVVNRTVVAKMPEPSTSALAFAETAAPKGGAQDAIAALITQSDMTDLPVTGPVLPQNPRR